MHELERIRFCAQGSGRGSEVLVCRSGGRTRSHTNCYRPVVVSPFRQGIHIGIRACSHGGAPAARDARPPTMAAVRVALTNPRFCDARQLFREEATPRGSFSCADVNLNLRSRWIARPARAPVKVGQRASYCRIAAALAPSVCLRLGFLTRIARGVSLVERNFYVARSQSGPVGCANSFFEALELAYKLSTRSASPLFVPSEIECLNTGERFNTAAIESWWRKLGWSLPK